LVSDLLELGPNGCNILDATCAAKIIGVIVVSGSWIVVVDINFDLSMS